MKGISKEEEIMKGMIENEVIHYTEELDGAFKQIKFYQIHPEYIPYVGKNYKNSKRKILLIGESHYISKEWNKDEAWKNYDEIVEKWENLNWRNIFKPSSCNDYGYINWFNTKEHANRGCGEGTKKEKAIKNLIQNPIKSLCNVKFFEEDYNQLLAENIAFMNLFQYPSIKQGKTVSKAVHSFYNKNEADEIWDKLFKSSLEVVSKAVSIIKPDVVIVLSADFCGDLTAEEIRTAITKEYDCYVGVTYHSADNRVWKREYKWLKGKNPNAGTPQLRFESAIKEYLSKDVEL